MADNMLTSKDVLRHAGISRATLNNYISLGILPRPVVGSASAAGSEAPRIGYFPETVLDTLSEVDRLKQEGVAIREIAARLSGGGNGANPPGPPPSPRPAEEAPSDAGAACGAETPASDRNARGTAGPVQEGPRHRVSLTIDCIETPAYMVNPRFQVEWANDAALQSLLGHARNLPAEIDQRNVFRLLFNGSQETPVTDLESLLRFHLAIAKRRLSKSVLFSLDPYLGDSYAEMLSRCYDEVDAVESAGPLTTVVNMAAPGARTPAWARVHATFFREGILFAYAPHDEDEETLLEFLGRRDVVIREILKNRKPFLTHLAVLVADLQNSTKICAELPPEEYFELINQIWSSMQPSMRRYAATHGKHVGDGVVYYFFPQPDSNCCINAIRCAAEMRQTMQAIDREWRERKRWTNKLSLNIGIDEGQEWFGTYQTPTHLEFTVLGDTINNAARISDFALDGSTWVTKNLMGALTSDERRRLSYGIQRQADDGRPHFVADTYSRILNLVDLEDPRNHKLRDIAVLPVTEVLDVRDP